MSEYPEFVENHLKEEIAKEGTAVSLQKGAKSGRNHNRHVK
jgi:hypothetical protein